MKSKIDTPAINHAKWEKELWSIVKEGKGSQCPLYEHCPAKNVSCQHIHNYHRKTQLILESIENNPHIYKELSSYIEPIEKCRVFDLIEMLADDLLDKNAVSQPPLSMEIARTIDNQAPIEIHQIPLKAYHGAIWYMDNTWLILLNKLDSDLVQRFTVFHEAFHIMAHSNTKPVFRKLGTDDGAFNEILADFFSMCMTLPRKWLTDKLEETQDIHKLAKIFLVQPEILYIRLRLLGMI